MDPTPFLTLGLKAIPIAVDKYPNVKQKAQFIKAPGRHHKREDDRRRGNDDGYDSYPGPSRDRNGRRYSTQDDHGRGSRSKSQRRRSDEYDRNGKRDSRRYDAPKERGYYASEAESPPPYSRRRNKSLARPAAAGAAAGGALALADSKDPNSTALTRYAGPEGRQMTRYNPSTRRARSETGYDSSSSNSSSSSSSTTISVSSTEDEKRARRLKYSVPITAGIAAIATIHAANGVHKSVKAHDKRVVQVANGEMTKEESKTLRNKGLFMDVAKVGLGVMSLQAAHAKWKEVKGGRKEYKEHKQAKRVRDEKREHKREKHRQSERGGNMERRDRRDSRGGGVGERPRRRQTENCGDGGRRDRDRNGGGGGGGRDRNRDGYRDGYHDGYRGRDRGLARRSEPDIRRYSTR